MVTSPQQNVTFRTPSCLAISRARSIARAETSIPATPPARAVRAAWQVVWPVPQPTSRT
jgi:hypothetical protein